MNFLKALKIKPSFFKDGWANFDAVSYSDLINSLNSGATMSSEVEFREINILLEYPCLMCFGKVSKVGEIIIDGISGFPADSICVTLLRNLYQNSKKSNISDKYIYIEI
jgi:hypothetical protein